MSSTKKQLGFMLWYGSYNGKKIVNIIYCLGASVVIIGALFKILHWPGASIVLMLGMFTEAFLFAIGCLDDPHAEYHWGNVFPQLLEYGTEPERMKAAELAGPVKLGNMGGGSGNGGAQQATPALSDSEMSALKDGISGLAKTAAQLTEIGKVATASNKLSENMEAASAAAVQFNTAACALSQKSEDLGNAYAGIIAGVQNVANSTRVTEEKVAQMNAQFDGVGAKIAGVGTQIDGVTSQIGVVGTKLDTVGTTLASMNSIYELQINAIQAQVEAYKAQTASVAAVSADMQKVQAAAIEAARSTEAYQNAAQHLAQQVADLNKVYGNMLNALA